MQKELLKNYRLPALEVVVKNAPKGNRYYCLENDYYSRRKPCFGCIFHFAQGCNEKESLLIISKWGNKYGRQHK